MKRVIFFGTHPDSTNGYSYVTTHVARELSKKPDIKLTIWGFQHNTIIQGHDIERAIPSNVQLIDALKNENPQQNGFGFTEITDFIELNKPDVCIIFNDMVVVSNIIEQIKKVSNPPKIIVYLDQVYLCQRKEFIDILNQHVDHVICFTEYWKEIALQQDIKTPLSVFEHGFDPKTYYKFPKHLARKYYNLNDEDFIIVNSNRNQPRKRLDLMMMAFAEVVNRHLEDPIKLVIATSPVGAWNLIEIYNRELTLRGIPLHKGHSHIVFIDNPQTLTDEDMNILYNAADVNINCASGEGFGLTNFISGGIGIPQIAPNVGGLKDFLSKDTAILVEPKLTLYTDMSIDSCPGLAELCDYQDFVDAIETYYASPDLRELHATKLSNHIKSNYKWPELVDKLYKSIFPTTSQQMPINKLKSKLKTFKLINEETHS